MKLQELFPDDDLVLRMKESKMITIRAHDKHPLSIVNYSDLAQYSNTWNEVTLNCRGLIFDAWDNIIARPWKKFFNLGDAKAPWIGFDDRVEVTDKMDGSLGILYIYDGKPSISTRGSFHSTQAAWATKRFRDVSWFGPESAGINLAAAREWTFLFEIIYPKNRIVVDYGNFEGLVLLGAVEIATGHYVGPNEAAALLRWPGLTTEVMPYRSINDVLAADDRVNTEGYVIRQGDHMVKWKRPDYVELHRLISNLSEKSVWSGLEGGKSVEELIDGLPDEFHGFVRETSARLIAEYEKREAEIQYKFIDHVMSGKTTHPQNNRKAFAELVKDDPDKKYMFALLDRKPIGSIIWQELKPKGGDDGDTISDNPRVAPLRTGDTKF